MSGIEELVRKLWRGFVRSVREFPVEALLGLTYFILFISGNKIGSVLGGTDPFGLYLWLFPHYVLVYTIHMFRERKPALKALYVLSWFLWIPLLLWCTKTTGWSLGIAYLLAVILLIIGKETLDNEPYGRNILDTVTNVAAGFIIGFLLLAIVDAIIASTNLLFNLDLDGKWFSYPFALIAFVIIPLLCCEFVSRTNYKIRYGSILQIAIDYILSPALVIYAAILYIYIIRIILKWELPNGGVAYLVASFLIVALVCHLLRLQVEKRHFEWFYKAFPAVAIAPLALLWVGVIRRISDYGITEARFYLMLLTLLLTLFVLMLIKERTRKFQLMTLILASAAFLFTYIPGIRAKDFEKRSQAGRIQEDPLSAEQGLPGQERERVWSLEPVDLGEYTQLVPSSEYHYYEDADVVIFYRDSTRVEELLRCEIRKALDSPGEDHLEKLVYKNDGYLAVFETIHDYHNSSISFSTGHRTLFKKQEQ